MKSQWRWLTYLLLGVNLIWTAYSYSKAPFVTPSVVASIVYVAALMTLGWLLLRRHPGASAFRSSRYTTILMAFLWGVGLSGVAVHLNSRSARILEYFRIDWLDAAAYSPLNEEILKMVGVLLICAGFLNIERAIEAVPIGIAVGLGFAASEDPHFIIDLTLKDLESDITGAVSGVIIRFLGCPFSHALYTGLVAFGVGVLLCRTGKIRSAFSWLLVGFGLHTAKNLGVALGNEMNMQFALMPVLLIGGWVLSVWLYLRSRKLAKCSQHSSAALG